MMVRYSYVIKRLITHADDPTKSSWFYVSMYTRLTGVTWTADPKDAMMFPEYRVYKIADRIAAQDRMCDECRRKTLRVVNVYDLRDQTD